MKRFLLLLSVCLFAALPVSDAFTNTNGTNLATHNAAWYNPSNTYTIDTNSANCGNLGGYCYAAWTGDTFANDQYSEAVIQGDDGLSYVGPMVRGSNSAATGYICVAGVGAVIIQRLSGGSVAASLDSDSATLVEGDTIRLEIEGTSITCKQNGVTISSATDATLASGYAGIAGYNINGHIRSWTAGNISTGIRRRPTIIQ